MVKQWGFTRNGTHRRLSGRRQISDRTDVMASCTWHWTELSCRLNTSVAVLSVKNPRTRFIVGWVESKSRLDDLGPCWESNPVQSRVWPGHVAAWTSRIYVTGSNSSSHSWLWMPSTRSANFRLAFCRYLWPHLRLKKQLVELCTNRY